MKIRHSALSLFMNRKKATVVTESGPTQSATRAVAIRYCLTAVAMFTLQGGVALLGAADLVIPDFPSPIPFEFGRSIHLGLATLWPTVGTIGMVYYSLGDELSQEIFSARIARWQYWVLILSVAGMFGALALRLGNGREFFEGLPVFYGGIALGLVLGSYNLVRTGLMAKARMTSPAAVMIVGMAILPVLLAPNIFSVSNPVADETVRFWVIHLWEELAFELTTSGFIAFFFKFTGLAERKDVEKWLYLEVTITVVSGAFGTAHHYYWIGLPGYWLVIGAVFSFIQLIPIIFLVHMVYKGLKQRRPTDRREKLVIWFLMSSLLYHVLGAYLMGFVIAIPWINLYMHGTLLTSAHAHLAVFGALGFLVLGGCYFCLSQGSEPTKREYRLGVFAVLGLNGGLMAMSAALLAGGMVQTYLWRVIGMEYMQVLPLLKPYFITRALGGSLFTLSDFILAWVVYKAWKKVKHKPKSEKPALSPAD